MVTFLFNILVIYFIIYKEEVIFTLYIKRKYFERKYFNSKKMIIVLIKYIFCNFVLKYLSYFKSLNKKYS